ncbi:MAG: c-type cytochrome [Ignavibacteria bacterium]|nr:c-type cytochrome [Ignavibacteria bacterium]
MFNNIFSSVKMKLIIIFFFFIIVSNIFAAGDSDFPPNYYDIIAIILVLIVIITFLGLIFVESKKVAAKKKEISLIARIGLIFNKSVPLEKEDEILLDHNYDGIKELDSRVPPWYTGLFYATIIFAVYYMLHFHVLNTGKSMHEEYEEEMEFALLQKSELMNTGSVVTEENVTLLTDNASLFSGKAIYDVNCVACHSADGGGLVGPNFTDEYWIHGGGIKNIFKIVKYGVPSKGMISWQTQLNPVQMQEVSSYIMTFQGKTPLSPKEPEGEVWVEPESPATENDDIKL